MRRVEGRRQSTVSGGAAPPTTTPPSSSMRTSPLFSRAPQTAARSPRRSQMSRAPPPTQRALPPPSLRRAIRTRRPTNSQRKLVVQKSPAPTFILRSEIKRRPSNGCQNAQVASVAPARCRNERRKSHAHFISRLLANATLYNQFGGRETVELANTRVQTRLLATVEGEKSARRSRQF